MATLPYVVIQAQKAARSNPELKTLLVDTMRELSQLNAEDQIRYVYQQIDIHLEEESKGSACKKGCHFCCFHPITVTPEEATLLNNHFRKIDQDRFKAQRHHFRDDLPIAYEERACIFLKEGECSIYNDRPIICRLTHVKSEPSDCHLEEGVEEISHLPVEKAAIVAAAFLMNSTDRELLPLSIKL